MAERVGDLIFEGGLQQPVGQLLQQPAVTGQLQVLGLDAAHQLVDQPAVHGLRGHSRCRLAGLVPGHALTGHRCTFHDRELHRTIGSDPCPAVTLCDDSRDGLGTLPCRWE